MLACSRNKTTCTTSIVGGGFVYLFHISQRTPIDRSFGNRFLSIGQTRATYERLRLIIRHPDRSPRTCGIVQRLAYEYTHAFAEMITYGCPKAFACLHVSMIAFACLHPHGRMFARLHVCMFACDHVRIRMFVFACSHDRMFACSDVRMFARLHVCMLACSHSRVCIRIVAFSHVRMFAW